VGVSASLIPFLEHDDANRALMGSNMQRQAVPLLKVDPPVVATGMEKEVARYSPAWSSPPKNGGTVTSPTRRIIIDNSDEYELRKFVGLNERTCLNQKPIVRKGEKVKKPGRSSPTAPRRCYGELALGRNVLVAFNTFDGYNFEDAIVINERLVKDDVFTSIHIDEFESRSARRSWAARSSRATSRTSARRRSAISTRRHHPRRHPRRPGRHPRRQGQPQEQERADPRGEAAARDLRPRGRGREERLARGPVGRRGHRDRRAEVP
jgi:DNA-directed RNA polymerase beta subunit